MSLLGLPLLLTAGAVALGAVAALAVLWRRLRGWWLVGRVFGVVLCQVLVLVVVGLAVNRSEGFYPSWQALMGATMPKLGTRDSGAALSRWLATQQQRGSRSGLSFAWRGEEAKGWHLRSAPTVFLPQAYFQPPTRALPVVLVLLGTGQAAGQHWDHAHLAAAAPAAPAVIVLLQTDAGGLATQLTTQLPAQLRTDLLVTSGKWGVVGVGSATPAAVDLFSSDPARFGSLALPGPGTTTEITARARAITDVCPLLTASHADPTSTLRWVYGQLPPALTAPLTVGAVDANG